MLPLALEAAFLILREDMRVRSQVIAEREGAAFGGAQQLLPRLGERFAFAHGQAAQFLFDARHTHRDEQSGAARDVVRQILGELPRVGGVGLAPASVAFESP